MARGALAAPKKGAVRKGQLIVFLDESGFSQRASVRRTWGPRGRTPGLPDHQTWSRISAIGALGFRPRKPGMRWFFTLKPGSINEHDIIKFLRSLRRHVRGRVLLIWDGLPSHRSKLVRGHVEAQQHWLQVERLPGYAPELNPVEQLWENMDANEMANFAPDDVADIARQARRGIRRVRRRSHLGWSFLNHTRLISKKEIPYLRETQ